MHRSADGQKQRRSAAVGYGMLASAAVFVSICTLLDLPDPDVAREPRRSDPGIAESEANAADVLTDNPGEGRVPTFFDGRGGACSSPRSSARPSSERLGVAG